MNYENQNDLKKLPTVNVFMLQCNFFSFPTEQLI